MNVGEKAIVGCHSKDFGGFSRVGLAVNIEGNSGVKGQLMAKFLAEQMGMNLFVSKPEA